MEQDLVICKTLDEIFSDPWLAERLAFRGGTALHKLYLSPQPRYSEDIDLLTIPTDYTPNVKYLPKGEISVFIDRIKWEFNHSKWIDTYKWAASKRLNTQGERTLQAAIIPQKSSHLNTAVTVTFEKNTTLIEFYAISNSLLFDFTFKSSGISNISQ